MFYLLIGNVYTYNVRGLCIQNLLWKLEWEIWKFVRSLGNSITV